MPAPIFLEADLYGPLLQATAFILVALFFPPGTFSNALQRVPRWRWVGTVAPAAIFYAANNLVLTALRRGAEAAGQDGLPYHLAKYVALALAIGLAVLLFRRLTPPKPQ